MNNEKWMPTKPECDLIIQNELRHGPVLGDKVLHEYEVEAISRPIFDAWWNLEIKPLFENATTLLSEDGCAKGLWDYEYGHYYNEATHQALLIKIEPIQKENTAEELLNEIDRLENDVRSREGRDLVRRIKSYLEKTKK